MRTIKLLALGDIVGADTVSYLRSYLPSVKESLGINFVVANGENCAHSGKGITKKDVEDLTSGGVDVITGGNHTFAKKEVFEFINSYKNVLRPANFHPSVPGNGSVIIEKNGIKIGVINLMGRIFMDSMVFISPFEKALEEIEKMKKETNIIVVDFHAEATSEKVMMGWFLDGKVSLVFGTHTHIQTADEKILPNGTGYITDIGMCGREKSVIGTKIEDVEKRIIYGLPEKLNESKEGKIELQGVISEIDVDSGKTINIERFRLLSI